MTVVNQDSPRVSYSGDNNTLGPFNFTFKALETSWVRVEGIISPPYTVTLNADQELNPGGFVTFVDPFLGEFEIVRRVPLSQLVDYTRFDAFPAESHEAALDKLTLALQDYAAIPIEVELQYSVDGVSGWESSQFPSSGDSYYRWRVLTEGGQVSPYTIALPLGGGGGTGGGTGADGPIGPPGVPGTPNGDDGVPGTPGENVTLYYIQKINGSIIRNGTTPPQLQMRVRRVEGGSDTPVNSGTVKLFNQAGDVLDELGGGAPGSTGYFVNLGPAQINGSFVVVLKDEITGEVYDTDTFVDVYDSTATDAIYGAVDYLQQPPVWLLDKFAVLSPPALVSSGTFTFFAAGTTIASHAFSVTLDNVAKTITAASVEQIGQPTTFAVLNDNSNIITVEVTHDASGVVVRESFYYNEYGTDGANGADGTNGVDGIDGINGTQGDPGLPGVDGFSNSYEFNQQSAEYDSALAPPYDPTDTFNTVVGKRYYIRASGVISPKQKTSVVQSLGIRAQVVAANGSTFRFDRIKTVPRGLDDVGGAGPIMSPMLVTVEGFFDATVAEVATARAVAFGTASGSPVGYSMIDGRIEIFEYATPGP